MYYSSLKKLWDELNNYTELPPSASNEIISILTKKREEEQEEQTYQFLMGLQDAMFGTFRSNIIQQEPITKVKTVLSMVTKKEQHRHLARTLEEKGDGVAFAVVKPGQAGDGKLSCTHYLQSSHESANCFQLIGFLDRWPEKSRSISRGRTGRGRGGRAGSSAGRGRGTAPRSRRWRWWWCCTRKSRNKLATLPNRSRGWWTEIGVESWCWFLCCKFDWFSQSYHRSMELC